MEKPPDVQGEFVADNHDQIDRVIGLVERVQLTHQPDMAAQWYPNGDIAYTPGPVLQQCDSEHPDEDALGRAEAMASEHLLHFKTVHQLNVINACFVEMGLEGVPEDEAPAELVQAASEAVKQEVVDLSYAFAVSFRTLADGRPVTVNTMTAYAPDWTWRGRDFSVSVSEDAYIRDFSVRELQFGQAHTLSVSQRFRPHRDEEYRKIQDYFAERNDNPAVATIFEIFQGYLANSARVQEKIDSLLARYDRFEDQQAILAFVQQMQQRAHRYQETAGMTRQMPELQLPDKEDLQDYATILEQLL